MAEQNKTNWKLMIGIIVLIIIIAAGTSFAFMRYFVAKMNEPEAEKQSKEIGTTYTLGDFIVNLSDSQSYQFVKASIVVETSQGDLVEELDKRKPQIRDRIIAILREANIEDIQEPGAVSIKNQIMTRLNQILTEGEITSVWFTQLVIQ